MYYILIVALIILDQMTKYLIRANLAIGESLPILKGIFHITYAQNTGAAFSVLRGHSWILGVFTCIVAIAMLYYIYKVKKNGSKILLFSLSLIVSGGIGNMIDRFLLGYVVDFFDFMIWPIFNVADVCVCCGCALLMWYVFFIEGKGNKQ